LNRQRNTGTAKSRRQCQRRLCSRPISICNGESGDYEELTSRFELYSQIKEGMDDVATGNTRLFSEAMADIRSHRSR
jgi:hypothetical protein